MNPTPMTEQSNEKSAHLDQCSISEMIEMMHAEDLLATRAVGEAKESLASLIESAVACFQSGGRLFYIGAGTSGRLGVLDASECPPTFGVSPDMVQGIIAGGMTALYQAAEGAEDLREQSAIDLKAHLFCEKDLLVGIASSGTTPYVREALRYAKGLGAATALITCNDIPQSDHAIDHYIVLKVGPEIVTGSTRLKAGTATKLALNMITTLSMVRLGKVYGNLMVDMNISNEKLGQRALRMMHQLTGLDPEAATCLLEQAHGELKTAALMHLKAVGYSRAKILLKDANGFLRAALEAA